MAGKPRRKKRVRTAAQRAALKKAQAASARKRRRRQIKRASGQAAGVVGSFLGVTAAYHAQNYARHPKKIKKDYQAGKKALKKYRHRNHKPATVNLGVPSIPPRRGYNPRYM